MKTAKKDTPGKRAPSGRPAADPANPRTVKIQTRISPSLRGLVARYASEAGLPLGRWVHDAILEYAQRERKRRDRKVTAHRVGG